jgi:hypothetical protein
MMIESNRVKPEQVVAAYQKTGARVFRNGWYDPSDTANIGCCGLGVLMLDQMGKAKLLQTEPNSGIASNVLPISSRYMIGFTTGFDGREFNKFYNSDTDYKDGFADGQAAWAAVDPSKLPVTKALPKTWPKTMLALPPRMKRIINNFMSSRMPDGDKLTKGVAMVTDMYNYECNQANWAADMRSYACPVSMHDYNTMRTRYIKFGPIHVSN